MSFPTHPQYDNFVKSVNPIKDALKGSRHVKDQGVTYLPPLPSMELDGMQPGETGFKAYDAYRRRAVFPEFVEDGVSTMTGILQSREAKVTVPAGMEDVVKYGSANGTNIQNVLADIYRAQLEEGRGAVVVDLPETPGPDTLPYMTVYMGTSCINWDYNPSVDEKYRVTFATFKEVQRERGEGFHWTENEVYRHMSKNSSGNAEFQIVKNVDEVGEGVELLLRGKPIDQVPVFFFSSQDNDPTPVTPPMQALTEICYSIYLSEADYRQNLYLQGQDTLVVIGSRLQTTKALDPNNPDRDAIRTGTGAAIELNVGGDAKYIGVNSSGLMEQRTALEHDYNRASQMAGKLLTPGKTSLESGEALKTRVAAQTATLTTIAKSGANALEMALRLIARWRGLDETKVKVEPNLDFTNVSIQGQDLVQLITAKKLGYPLSMRDLHNVLVRRGLTTATFEETVEQIKNDPEVLTRMLEEVDNGSVAGNNPTEAVGGPKASTASKNVKTNVPKERQGA